MTSGRLTINVNGGVMPLLSSLSAMLSSPFRLSLRTAHNNNDNDNNNNNNNNDDDNNNDDNDDNDDNNNNN